MSNNTESLVDTVLERAIMHPLVLLSVVDHYERVAEHTNKRVVGILLGTSHKGVVDITNSYAVPFEEDPKNPNTWYFDHNYHETMFSMFRKVNSSERVVGWYSSSPLITPSDSVIHEVIRNYCHEPVFSLVDINPQKNKDSPCKVFISVPITPEPNSPASRVFIPLPCSIGAEEAEEVGVEHLLRDMKITRNMSLSDDIKQHFDSLSSLHAKLSNIYAYLDKCARGDVTPNTKIIDNVQNILALVPNVADPVLFNAINTKNSDNAGVVYVANLARVVVGLHDLLTNKLTNKETEQSASRKKALEALLKDKSEEDDLPAVDIDTIGETSLE